MDGILEVAFGLGIVFVIGALAVVGATARRLAAKALDALETRTGVEIDAARRKALDEAIVNAVALAEDRLGRATPEAVIDYLRSFNPGTLGHFPQLARPDALHRRVAATMARTRAPGRTPEAPPAAPSAP